VTTPELFFLALGLSADAFAVGVGLGLGSSEGGLKKSIIAGAWFGIFQAAMPLIGFFAATRVAGAVAGYSRWIAFALLLFLGGRMLYGAFKKESDGPEGRDRASEVNFAARHMFILAVATSIDALAAGVTLAFTDANIVAAVILIGVVTFFVSATGVRIGAVFGEKFKNGATIAGGIILILIGVRVVAVG